MHATKPSPYRLSCRCLLSSRPTVSAAFVGLLAWCLAASAPASIHCRLTTSVAESSDINAHVQAELGAGSAVADWLALKDQYNGDLTALYGQCGLADGQSALVTSNGNRYWPDQPSRHYYVKRSDAGPPDGLRHDWFGTLYLQSYSPVNMPVLATTGYRLGTARAETANIPSLLEQEFGIGALLAEWNKIKTDFATNAPGLHRQTGLTNLQSAFVTRSGERWVLNESTRHYYLTRSDSGSPSGGVYDIFNPYYLQSWYGVNMQPVATVTLRASAAMSETSNIPAMLETAYGVGAVLVDWNEIKAQGAAKLGGFYADTNLRDGQIAWVTFNGNRFNPTAPARHYYVYRSDSGDPGGVTYDSVGNLYLQSYNGMSKPAICKMAVPAMPTVFAASDNTSPDHVALTWTNGARTASCKILRGTTNLLSSATALAIGVTGNAYNDTTAVGGQMYYYWLEAQNTAGVSGWTGSDAGTRLYQITLNPTTKSLSNAAPTYPVTVTCNGAWTATDNQTWISVDPAASAGNGTVNVTVTANNTSVVTRTGTVTIGGQTHTLTQEGVVWTSPAAFRLTASGPETADLSALVTSTFGSDATLADWNQIVAQSGNNLASFYTGTGLGDMQIAWATYNGEHFVSGSPPRHYYVIRSDSGRPTGLTYTSSGSLYLQSWSGLSIPTVGRMRYQLSSVIDSATDPLDWARRHFGSGVQIAEWNTIKAAFTANPNLFYAHTGLRDNGVAWVKYGGALVNSTGLRYFVQRFDLGAPLVFGVIDQMGSLYLGKWNLLTAPVLADMSTWSAAGYDTWISGSPGVPPELRGRTNDTDGDGSPNLVEYAACADPCNPAIGGGLTAESLSGSNFRATFRRSTTASGISDRTQWSPDLVHWAESGGTIDGTTVSLVDSLVSSGSGYEIRRVFALVTQGGTNRIFLRRVVDDAP